MIKESCCQFGERKHLSGILTDPGHGAPRTAVVLVSAGLSPKHGPFRLYAQLARRLSQDGQLTFRFDLGGIGDSQEADKKSRLKLRTDQDIRAALDFLTHQHSLDRIVLAGLCSGAEDSFRYAELDRRVTGVVMIDPFAYRTSGWRWRSLFFQSAKTALSALRLYRNHPRQLGPSAEETGARKSLVDYKYIEHAEASRILSSLIERKANLHFVYTGGMSEYFNHPRQLKAMFAGIELGDRVTVDHFARIGHTQLLADDRELLIESIAGRLRKAA